MINTCINKNTTFYKAVDILNLTAEQKAQITDKLNQKAFIDWYGKGQVDSFGQPKLIDEIYIINDKREKISIRDLLNDDFYKKRQNYSKDLTELDKIKNFLDESNINIAKRISAYRGTEYAEKLEKLLEYLKTLKQNDYTNALAAHYEYIRKTTEDFELRFKNYDINKGVKTSKADDIIYKNFLRHSKNFLQSFSKIKNLDFPVIDSSEEKEIIKNLKSLESRVNELTNRTNAEIEAITRDILDQYISNPEVRKGVIDFLAAQTDESKIQYLLDAMGDSHNTLIAAIDKFFKKSMYDKDQEVKAQLKDWRNYIKSFGGDDNFNNELKKILEYKEGKETGKFIQKYNQDFYEELYDLVNHKNTLEANDKKDTPEYTKALDNYFKFKRDNIEQKYTKSYYEALNLLIPEARKAKEDIDIIREKILEKKDLSIEDFQSLNDLDSDLKWLKSTVNRDGSKKTELDLKIANSLTKYNEEVSKFYHVIAVDQKSFSKANKEAKEKGDSYYSEWLKNNTKEVPNDKFWEHFKKILDQLPKSQELEDINRQIKQLTIGYRNDKREIKVNELPKDVRKLLENLQSEKVKIKESLNNNLSLKEKKKISDEFRRLIIFKPTTEYIKIFNEKRKQLEEIESTQSKDSKYYIEALKEFNDWFNKNHERNPYTEQMGPINIWTKMIPRDKKFIEVTPNGKYNITGIKPEFNNPNYEIDYNGYAVPTSKWLDKQYSSLSDKSKETLNYIIKGNDSNFKGLLYLVAHTKGDIIKKGYLPAIPKDNQSKEETSFQDIAVTESDDIVKFIPFKYIKRLINEAKIQEIPDDATQEEIERIKKENEAIKKSAHGQAVDYNLASTMEVFIKAALTNKYKSQIETDLQLFKEQLKNQKIRTTNARGDNYFDKIKSQLKGQKIEHEVSAVGSNIEKRFLQWLDSVFYDDFKLDEGWLTKVGDTIQDLTSLRALGFNVLSGLNNKVIGNIQERIESAGGIYFSYKDYRFARTIYFNNLTSFISNHNKEYESNNFIDAFIKDFDILISQDEIASRPEGKLKSIINKARRLKNASFFLQHIGEHQVQNASLLAMANSHRVIDGKILNFNEYWEYKKHPIKFNREMSKEDIDIELLAIENNHLLKDQIKIEFENFPKLIDLYELKDNKNSLKEGIVLSSDEIFNFRERVLGINQRLHGIYNKEDANVLQRYTLGRLSMQFRKFLRPAWNKRFGRRFGKTDYNERIRDYEEGMYISTFKYLFNPAIDNWKEFKKDQEKTVAKAFRMILNSIKDTFTNAKVRWHSMTELQKANVKRTAMEFNFLIAAILLGLLFKKLKGDDDDDELADKSLTVALYQCDRLFGELTTFTPVGIVREGNRLFDSPSPVFNTFEDLFKLGANIFTYPFRDEEERKFKTGIYHGEDKIDIYLKDMIPVYNQLQRLEYMNESNNRYGLLRNNGFIMQMLD